MPLDDSLHEALNFGLARAVRVDTFACIDAPARGGLGVDVALREAPYAMDHELSRVSDGALIARAPVLRSAPSYKPATVVDFSHSVDRSSK